MNIRFSYLAPHDAWLVAHENVSLRSPEDITTWRGLFEQHFARREGRKEFLLINMAGFHVDYLFSSSYGKVAREVVIPRVAGLIRFGATDGLTLAQVRLQAVVNRYPAMIVKDLDAALELLAQIRSLPEP